MVLISQRKGYSWGITFDTVRYQPSSIPAIVHLSILEKVDLIFYYESLFLHEGAPKLIQCEFDIGSSIKQ